MKEGTTTKVSDAHDDYQYKLHVVYKIAFLSKNLYPEGHQTIRAGAGSETIVTNEILNYKDSIKAAGQTTRLIPWENGFLLEDTVRIELPKESGLAGIVKNKMRDFFTRYVSKFRAELHADY